jgi:hypothetical protein
MATDIESLDKEYAKKRAEIVARDALLATLPQGIPAPKYVHYVDSKGRPWIKYEVATLAEAMPIIRAYGELDFMDARESGCLSITRASWQSKEYADATQRWEITECIELRQHGGKGFYSAELVFYPVAYQAKVIIEVSQFPYQFRASMRATYTNEGDVAKATFVEPAALQGMFTERVKYGGGGRDAFDYRLYFSGPDHFEDVLRLLPDKVTA